MGLPPRLLPIARWAGEFARVADVGAGDGRLSRWLAERGVAVVATELTPARAARLRQHLTGWSVDIRWGDGLAPIADADVEAVVVAGMSGPTLAAILERGHAQASGRWFLLQPVQGYWRLRRWVRLHGGMIAEATLAVQAARAYACLKVRFATAQAPLMGYDPLEDWTAPEFSAHPAYRLWLKQVAGVAASSSRHPAAARERRHALAAIRTLLAEAPGD
jgi:tRNA A22 N-methylase